jgi:hypothetical protein
MADKKNSALTELTAPAWTWIDAVRAASNRLEADTSLTVGDANWPTQ